MRRRLVLASASPARLTTLRAAGLDPVVIVSGVDELGYAVGASAPYAQRLATAKAGTVAALPRAASSLVIGCDSVLDLEGRTLGKPHDPDEAVRRWRSMRGRSAELVTGHCVIDTTSGRHEQGVARTVVEFADLSDAEIDAYVATREPLHVAGGFTIDGLGGAFVTRIEGDHHNVVGISLPLLRLMLGRLGVQWTDLWTDLSV
ncbi:MAG: septum formation inhibitor Maf [Propionibacteriales bacterium]|nr:septum formation inhibitor Maf [Propionibacteriales bacterium]